ncbi:MAG: ABC transporter permease [Thermomicrobiales bacterium]
MAGPQLVSLLPLGLFVALAVLGPWLGSDPTGQDLANRLRPPVLFGGEWGHPLGTDGLGRDVLARMLVGARLSLIVGLVAASISALIGVSLGLLAGSRGGLLDTITTAVVELSLSVPTIVIGIVLVSTLGQSLTNLLVILVISGWIGYARVVRLQARNLAQADFITGAVALGATRSRIAFVHVLPNVMPQVIVIFCQQVAAVMLWEASLTYLGIGLPIERISLGGMIREGQEHVFDGWWIAFMPGLAIALAVIGFNLLADWLQQARGPQRWALREIGRSRLTGKGYEVGE